MVVPRVARDQLVTILVAFIPFHSVIAIPKMSAFHLLINANSLDLPSFFVRVMQNQTRTWMHFESMERFAETGLLIARGRHKASAWFSRPRFRYRSGFYDFFCANLGRPKCRKHNCHVQITCGWKPFAQSQNMRRILVDFGRNGCFLAILESCGLYSVYQRSCGRHRQWWGFVAYLAFFFHFGQQAHYDCILCCARCHIGRTLHYFRARSLLQQRWRVVSKPTYHSIAI